MKFAVPAIAVICLTTSAWAELIFNADGTVKCTGGCTTEVSADGSSAKMCDSAGNCITIKIGSGKGAAEPPSKGNPDTSPI